MADNHFGLRSPVEDSLYAEQVFSKSHACRLWLTTRKQPQAARRCTPPQNTRDERLQTSANFEKQLAHAHGEERHNCSSFDNLHRAAAAVFLHRAAAAVFLHRAAAAVFVTPNGGANGKGGCQFASPPRHHDQ